MKLHRHLCDATVNLAKTVLVQHRVLDHALAAAFEENPRWGKRDRSFVAETLFEVTRWRRAHSFLVDSEETLSLCVAQWILMGYELPEWCVYHGASREEILSRQAELPEQSRAIRESIPDWLDRLGEEELGEDWEVQLRALNQRSSVFLRVNTLLSDVPSAIKWLAENQVEATPVPGLPHALALPAGKTLPKNLRFDGRIEIQDPASQSIAPLLDPQPGQRIIDACSGAGGKALHLAALGENAARVFAMDVDQKKLAQLEHRARRAKATCISPKAITEDIASEFENVADSLLIDAPCSGLGTLKRQPDLKWRLKPAQLDRVRKIQAELLRTYPKMLKPGGKLLYATCSILPSENGKQIESLLATPGFESYRILRQLDLSPATSGFDGFHATLLEKVE